jgi:hypothetical protein
VEKDFQGSDGAAVPFSPGSANAGELFLGGLRRLRLLGFIELIGSYMEVLFPQPARIDISSRGFAQWGRASVPAGGGMGQPASGVDLLTHDRCHIRKKCCPSFALMNDVAEQRAKAVRGIPTQQAEQTARVLSRDTGVVGRGVGIIRRGVIASPRTHG